MPESMQPDEIAAIVFIDIAVIVVVARLMGALFRRIRQPAVVGEILAGILLGPTLLGAFPGNLDGHLFPTDVRPFLNVIAQLGLIIFMFIVGMELDVKLIRGKERIAAVVSMASIAAPFALGILLAAALYASHDVVSGQTIDFVPFALFIGASMSVTAFPVLARILTERGMYRTDIGALTLACAAVDDILAWSLLAVVVAVVDATGAWDLPRILALSIAFITVMFTIVKPLLARVAARYREVDRLTPNIFAIILVGLLASSYATSKIGIHSIFGAFLFGAIMPREDTARLFEEILERLENVSVILLLPVFFIATGLDANVRGIGLDGVGQLALILLVACAGKFLGASAAAQAQGLHPRKAAAIGVLMNTRGLTELVILNIGLSKGVLTPQLFTLLVVMAIATTVITEPLLRLVYPDRQLARDIADAEKAALGRGAYRVLVVVDDPDGAAELVELGVDVLGRSDPAEVVLTRFLPATDRGELGSGLTLELGDMAASLAALQELSGRAGARSARSVVLSQFSEDIPRDLLAQAETVDANVVLTARPPVGESDPRLDRLIADVDCDLAVWGGDGAEPPAGGTAGPVAVLVDAGPDSAAAVEVAARIARARGVELELVAGEATARRSVRRLRAVAAQLEACGVKCRVVAEIGAPGLLVRGLADDTVADAPVLAVKAKPALVPDTLEARIERLGPITIGGDR